MIKIIKDSFMEHVFNMNKFLYISEVHEIEIGKEKPYDPADESTHGHDIAYFVSVSLVKLSYLGNKYFNLGLKLFLQ